MEDWPSVHCCPQGGALAEPGPHRRARCCGSCQAGALAGKGRGQSWATRPAWGPARRREAPPERPGRLTQPVWDSGRLLCEASSANRGAGGREESQRRETRGTPRFVAEELQSLSDEMRGSCNLHSSPCPFLILKSTETIWCFLFLDWELLSEWRADSFLRSYQIAVKTLAI